MWECITQPVHDNTDGLPKGSPVLLGIPQSGRRHAAVEMQGLRGTVRSLARIFSRDLSRIQALLQSWEPRLARSFSRDLSPIQTLLPSWEPISARSFSRDLSPIQMLLPSLEPRLVQSIAASDSSDTSKEFDVFISHASEDKVTFVRPLVDALKAKGLTVWYDDFELKPGDDIRIKTDLGILQSRVGVVVLSRAFIKKEGWANYEIRGLVHLAVRRGKRLFPILHNITQDEVIGYSPSVAGTVAYDTSKQSISEIADDIAALIR